jgi:hypothetical protein
MRDLQNIAHELKQRGVTLKATEQPIDTSTAAGEAFFDMLGVFAEFETNLRRRECMRLSVPLWGGPSGTPADKKKPPGGNLLSK